MKNRLKAIFYEKLFDYYKENRVNRFFFYRREHTYSDVFP